jgi:hypothetical protein
MIPEIDSHDSLVVEMDSWVGGVCLKLMIRCETERFKINIIFFVFIVEVRSIKENLMLLILIYPQDIFKII